MSVEYIIAVSVDLGAMLPGVARMTKSINDAMLDFGFHEEMTIRSQLFDMRLTVEREITKAEQAEFERHVLSTLRESHPDWAPRIESFTLAPVTTNP